MYVVVYKMKFVCKTKNRKIFFIVLKGQKFIPWIILGENFGHEADLWDIINANLIT